jgi:hypothetical protein
MGTDTDRDRARNQARRRAWLAGAVVLVLGSVGWLALSPTDRATAPAAPAAPIKAGQTQAFPPDPAATAPADTAPAAAVPDAAQAGLALVVGRVTWPADAGAGSADVVVAGSGVWPPRRVASAADGSFQLELPPGVYELRATRAALVATPLEGVDLDAGDRRELTLELRPGMTLRGQVLRAETGAPIAGAAVQVAEDSLGMTAHAVISDAEGRFQVPGLRALSHRVSVQAAGYVSVLGQERAPGPQEQPFLLRRAASLEGVVVNAEDGAPLADVALEVRGETEFGEPVRLSEDALGFQAELFEQARRGPLELGDPSSLGVTLGAVPKVPLLGAPLPGGPSVGAGPSAEPDARFRTDAAGRFRITGLPAGRVRLIAQKAGFAVLEGAEVSLRSGQPLTGLRLALDRGGRIAGQVSDPRGFPVPLVRVELSSPRERMSRSVLAADDGSFQFDAVLGRCSVTAQAVGLPPVSARVVVTPGATSELKLVLPSEALTLRGRVVDTARMPVEHALVRLRTAGPQPLELGQPTEPDGTFQISGLPAPPFEVTVEHAGHAAYQTRVSDTAEPLEVVLAEGFGLRGQVRDALEDEPLPGVRVELSGASLPEPLSRTTRSLGGFEFSDLAAGNYELFFSSPHHAPESRAVPLTAALREPLELDPVALTPAGTVSGEVVDRLGAPVYGAEVSHGEPPDWALAVRTDHEGHFVLPGVPAGSVALYARLAGEEVQADEPVEVRAGEEAPGNLLRLASLAPEPADEPEPAEPGSAPADPGSAQAGSGRTEEGVALALAWQDKAVVVTAVGVGSRAAAAGVRVGDKLRSVDGESVLAAGQGRAMLRGPAGSRLRVQLARGGKLLLKHLECERYPAF